jgi:vanillate O-demethylase monooxygenase subunit
MDQVMNMPTNQGQATGQSLSNGLLEDNYPRNMWWVAARGDEVGEKPLARWLLEKPVALYRLKDDTPAALGDRCPHRYTVVRRTRR